MSANNFAKGYNDDKIPEIDFNKFILFKRTSSSEIQRQITISRYRTFMDFDFNQVLKAAKKCEIKANEEFGVIHVRTSQDKKSPEDMRLEITGLNLGNEWIRALFGIIGEVDIRRLDIENKQVDYYTVLGVLKNTFLTEYYRSSTGELNFITYGGSKFGPRLNSKHKLGFNLDFEAQSVGFTPEFVKDMCRKFRDSLSSINYMPREQPDYGNADSASLKTKRKKVLSSNAKLVKQILENPKILIENFEASLSLYIPEIAKNINISFTLYDNGRVRLTLPKINFGRSMNEIEFEKKFYNIVKKAYANITGFDTALDQDSQANPTPVQSIMNFIDN